MSESVPANLVAQTWSRPFEPPESIPASADVVIIGGGSAGLMVAAGAAGLGAKAALVEARKMGGDCLNFGCVPSKTLISAANLAASMARGGQGIGAGHFPGHG